MSEDEWQTTNDMRALSKALPQPLSKRKLVLGICAYAERIKALVPAPALLELLGTAEAAADAGPFPATLVDTCAELYRFTGGTERNGPGSGLCIRLLSFLRYALPVKPFVGRHAQEMLHAAVAHFTHPDPGADWRAPAGRHSAGWWAAFDREEAAHADILRDVLANPFRPVTFHPEWRTGTVLALAQGMYESRDFSAVPILADALQDAGCDNADVLSHCRGDGPHVRGCWVVDMALGRE